MTKGAQSEFLSEISSDLADVYINCSFKIDGKIISVDVSKTHVDVSEIGSLKADIEHSINDGLIEWLAVKSKQIVDKVQRNLKTLTKTAYSKASISSWLLGGGKVNDEMMQHLETLGYNAGTYKADKKFWTALDVSEDEHSILVAASM